MRPSLAPWSIAATYGSEIPRVLDAQNYEVARCYEPAESRDANANLISAAPDLLAAARAGEEAELHVVHCADCDMGFCEVGAALNNRATELRRSAITKAEGYR